MSYQTVKHGIHAILDKPSWHDRTAYYIHLVLAGVIHIWKGSSLKKTNICNMKRVVSSTARKEGIWRCDPCRWYYYPEKGDPTQNVPPGTPFEDLLPTWRCPICKEPKSIFTLIR